MSKSASTLSIRLQLPPDDEQQQKPRPDEVEYLWDRIIIAALAATVVVLAVIAGAWYWLAEPEPEMSSKAALVQTPPAQEEPAVQAEVAAPVIASAPSPAGGETEQAQAAGDPTAAPQLNSVAVEPAVASAALGDAPGTDSQTQAAAAQTAGSAHSHSHSHSHSQVRHHPPKWRFCRII